MEMTKRSAIDLLRNMLLERNADTEYSNQFLYNVIMEHAKWLIRREISAGRIYKNTYFFQTLPCVEIIESSTIDKCCPIKTNCKIFRSKEKIPDTWIDTNGPAIGKITSIDNSMTFEIIHPKTWISKKDNPYNIYSKEKYVFFSDGYLWFPIDNPRMVNIYAFFVDDISSSNLCGDEEECVRFLDTRLMIPDWIEGELFTKSLEQLAGVTKRMIPDEDINKNSQRR